MTDDEFLTVQQVAEILRRHVRTVRRYIRDGRLPASLVDDADPRSGYLIRRSDLDRFIGPPTNPQ